MNTFRLVPLLVLLSTCQGCGYFLIGLAEPFRHAGESAEARESNGQFHLAGQIVDPAGHPIDQCTLIIRSIKVTGAEPGWGHRATIEEFAETRTVVSSQFDIEMAERRVIDLRVSGAGYFDSRLQFNLQTDSVNISSDIVDNANRTDHPDQILSGPAPFNRTDLKIVLEPGLQTPTEAYFADLRATRDAPTPRINLYSPPDKVHSAFDRKPDPVPGDLYLLPDLNDDQSIRMSTVPASVYVPSAHYPQRLRLVIHEQDAGFIPVKAKSLADLKVAPESGYRNGLILDENFFGKQNPTWPQDLYFYFKSGQIYGRGKIQFTPASDRVYAKVQLLLRRDGQRELSSKRRERE